MMTIRFLFSVIIIAVFCSFANSANADNTPLVKMQPKVMVIPFTKADQTMREVYEHDLGAPVRTTITRVKDGLDQQGIETVDFRAVIKQLGNTQAMTSNQQSSIKQRIIELSSADIYVEAETQIVRTPSGNSATVILTAYDAFTGRSLVNKVGHSPKFYTENYEKLAEKALDTFLPDFTVELFESFQGIILNGRLIAIDIGISENSTIDMDSDVGDSGDLLSDVIENWFDENAHNGDFHIQGVTATKIILDEVRIPAIDAKTNRIYRPSKFAAKIRRFLIDQGYEVTRDVQGGKIFITIEG